VHSLTVGESGVVHFKINPAIDLKTVVVVNSRSDHDALELFSFHTNSTFHIRFREKGDKMLINFKTTCNLNKYFASKKIPLECRDSVPIVATQVGGTAYVVCVYPFWVSPAFKYNSAVVPLKPNKECISLRLAGRPHDVVSYNIDSCS